MTSKRPTPSVATERALFHLASGNCYFPECSTPVLSIANGHPIVSVEIAHIRGLKPESSRYDPSMTDEQRNAFGNLILLCTVHHKLVDRIEPDRYPVETLHSWKQDNEPIEGLEALSPSDAITASNLERILEEFASKRSSIREIEVDLSWGIVLSESEVMTIPKMDPSVFFATNPNLVRKERVLVASMRNTGTLPVGIEAVALEFRFHHPNAEGEPRLRWLGRNDFPLRNPILPYRLLDGSSVRWYTDFQLLDEVREKVAPMHLVDLCTRVTLGTGKDIDSNHLKIDELPTD